MIVCALIPRFELLVAAGGAAAQLGRPLALAPEPGSNAAGGQAIGVVSGAAGAYGVRPGMRLAEALSRCPELILLPPDPGGVERAWERILARLESIGATIESDRPGESYFESRGLHDLHGGLEGVLSRTRQVLPSSARLGAGPSRICAFAVAARRRPRRRREPRTRPVAGLDGGSGIVPEGAARAFLAPLPVGLLRGRSPLGRPTSAALARGRERESERMLTTLERLGIRTLGEFAALERGAVADRFGSLGLTAWRLAQGEDEPLRPRRPREELGEWIELPEAASGQSLERALELLVDRLLANRRRRGRSIRRLRLEAQLAAGGGWRSEATLRTPSSSPERLLLALGPKLAQLPAPARELGLRAVALGPAGGEQLTLNTDPAEERRDRLGEAIRQARAACGRDALLRVLAVDPDSHVPERRAILTPFHDR